MYIQGTVVTTNAQVKLQTTPNDAILLYTPYYGQKDNILQSGSNLDAKWQDAISKTKALIKGKETLYPLITRWCKETDEFLNQAPSLEKYCNLITGQDLGHLHSSQAINSAIYDSDRASASINQFSDINYCLSINPHGDASVRNKKLKSINPKPATMSISFQRAEPSGLISETLYQTNHCDSVDVLDDLFTIPLFFREMALVLRAQVAPVHGIHMLTNLHWILERFRRNTGDGCHPDIQSHITLESMLQVQHSFAPFGTHLSMIGQHLSLFRPTMYHATPASGYLLPPTKLLTLSSVGKSNTIGISSDEKTPMHWKRKFIRATDNASLIRQTAHSLCLTHSHSHSHSHPSSAKHSNHNGVSFNYVEDVVTALFSVANLKTYEWDRLIENTLLKGSLQLPSVSTKIVCL